MTPIDELRRLLSEATPRPWNEPGFPGDVAVWTSGEGVAGGAICYVNFDNVTGDHDPTADAALIVAAVNSLPALLDERERLVEALDRIERDAVDTTEYPRYQPGEDFDEGWNAVRSRWINSVRDARAALNPDGRPWHPVEHAYFRSTVPDREAATPDPATPVAGRTEEAQR